MKNTKRILTLLLLMVMAVSVLSVPALALTESEVEAQVAASGKAGVAGNVLIWFLCAVAFLKVSQKVDSFMASLGVNVGHTGGSLLAEAMIAMRSVTMVVGAGRKAGGGRASGAASGSTSNNSGWFLKGGLAGVASRMVTNSAIKTATTQTSAVRTAQSEFRQTASASTTAAQGASDTRVNSDVHHSGSTVYAANHVSPGAPLAGAPAPEGVIVTGGSPAPLPPIEGSPDSLLAGAPALESAVITGGSPAQLPLVEKTPAYAPAPPGEMPSQEGVIITGNEAQTLPPQPGLAPQVADELPASVPADAAPLQEGIIITEGSPTVYAPQNSEVISGGAGSTVRQEQTAFHHERHTEGHSERTSQASHTATSSTSRERTQTSRFHTGEAPHLSLGGMVFSKSLAAGGGFANDVIGTVARGEVAGSITGDLAAQSLTSYMGYPAIGVGPEEAPRYTDVEIGRGRITGTETASDGSAVLPFAMYHVDQYTAPTGDFTKIFTADGTQWYKQYAQDAVERKPYKAPDDTIAYHERIVKKLPDPPKRKDRI